MALQFLFYSLTNVKNQFSWKPRDLIPVIPFCTGFVKTSEFDFMCPVLMAIII